MQITHVSDPFCSPFDRRFWLASCIEVFMRGSDPRHQEYIAQFGLMEHIVEQILEPGFQLSSEYQVSSTLTTISEVRVDLQLQLFNVSVVLVPGPTIAYRARQGTQVILDLTVI